MPRYCKRKKNSSSSILPLLSSSNIFRRTTRGDVAVRHDLIPATGEKESIEGARVMDRARKAFGESRGSRGVRLICAGGLASVALAVNKPR